jgi:pilus assembly protein CpaE
MAPARRDIEDAMSEFTTTAATELPSAAAAGLIIAASRADIDGLLADDAARRFDRAQMCRLDSSEPVPADVLAAARLLVLEADPAVPASLQRIRAIRSQRPALPIIAAVRSLDVAAVRTLVRQGIADVIELPFVLDELVAMVAEVDARLAPATGKGGVAPLIAMVGGVGGSGTTTVLTHFAAQAARARNLRICVLDLDVQSGEVAYYCGQTPRLTIEALLGVGDRLDDEFVASATIDSGHGFFLIAAPDRVLPLDEVRADEVLAMLAIVRRQYDLVLVDLPTDWTSWALSVVDTATQIVMVTDLSVACLRQAKRRLDLFEQVGIDAEVRLVANRLEHKLFRTFNLKDAAEALRHPFVAALPNVGQDMIDAQDEGLLLFEFRRHAKFGEALEQLCDELLGRAE